MLRYFIHYTDYYPASSRLPSETSDGQSIRVSCCCCCCAIRLLRSFLFPGRVTSSLAKLPLD